MAQPADDAPRGAWWEAFNDPDLNALEAQVDISNQTIAAAEARVREATAATEAARAALWPVVNVSGTAQRNSVSECSSRGGSGSSGSNSSYNVPLGASWEPDLWGGIRRNIESNSDTAQASAADLAAARLSVQATLAQTYLLLRVQDAQIELLRQTVTAYERSLQLTRNQYAAGIVARGDVAQAEAQLKSTQAQVFDAQITRAQLEHAVAVLVGKPPSELSIAAARRSSRSIPTCRSPCPRRCSSGAPTSRRPSGARRAPTRRSAWRRPRSSPRSRCRPTPACKAR